MSQTQVSLTVLTECIQRALVKFPEHRIRIERAAYLIVMGHVERNKAGGFAVRSQTKPGQRYAVSSESCACEDQTRHPERACKHRLAIRLILIAEQRQAVLEQRERISAALTPAEIGRLSDYKRRYEARQTVKEA